MCSVWPCNRDWILSLACFIHALILSIRHASGSDLVVSFLVHGLVVSFTESSRPSCGHLLCHGVMIGRRNIALLFALFKIFSGMYCYNYTYCFVVFLNYESYRFAWIRMILRDCIHPFPQFYRLQWSNAVCWCWISRFLLDHQRQWVDASR